MEADPCGKCSHWMGAYLQMCGNGIRCLARFLAEVEEDEGEQRYTLHFCT